MLNFKKTYYLFCFFFIMIFFTACGDTNFFGWSHKEGSNKSVAALTADADKAISDGNYSKAAEYYQEVLAKDTDNSVAMYGMAQAAYGQADVQLSKIVSSFITDSSSSGSSAKTLANTDKDILPAKSGSNLESLIPSNLDLQKLYANIGIVAIYLRKIADGQGDGVIKADDPDVNINLAIALVIRAALSILDTNVDGIHAGSDDLVSIKQDYTITIPTQAELDELKDSEKFSEYKDKVKQAIVDLVGIAKAQEKFPSDFSGFVYEGTTGQGAIAYLQSALNSGKLPSSSTLSDLKTSFDKLFEDTNTSDISKYWNDINQ